MAGVFTSVYKPVCGEYEGFIYGAKLQSEVVMLISPHNKPRVTGRGNILHMVSQALIQSSPHNPQHSTTISQSNKTMLGYPVV